MGCTRDAMRRRPHTRWLDLASGVNWNQVTVVGSSRRPIDGSDPPGRRRRPRRPCRRVRRCI
ncbi:hypothetical protein SEVIR_5G379450v4 [Setaria viridis]